MNRGQYNAIVNTIELIDKGIKQPMDLEQLSVNVGISKYHLHRLFKSITGKSLMSYVRGRKLSLSALELIKTDFKIIDIATEFNFEHEQSYIRAFKQMFQMTPAQFRKAQIEIPIEQKIDVNHLMNIGQGLMLEPRMCIRPEFYVEGLQDEIIHEENYIHKTTNKLAMEFESSYLPNMKNVKDDGTYIGLVTYSDNPQYSNYYASCVEVNEPRQVELPAVNYTIATQEYVVFRYVGLHSPYETTFETLNDLYQFIDQWILETAYHQTKPFHFERMNLRVCSSSYCEMDIYMPISTSKIKYEK